MAEPLKKATVATSKTKLGESRESEVETHLVREECSALRDEVHPDIPLVVTLKSKLDESRGFEVETRLVIEECSALRDEVQPNIPLVVDLDANILELLVSFLQLRKSIRDEFPGDDTTNTPAWRPKKKRIQKMEDDWVNTKFHGKYTPTMAKLMMAAHHLDCKSLQEVLSEWIVEKMVDVYPKEINAFFGIKCDLSRESLRKHRVDYEWAYQNVANSLKQKQRRETADHNKNNNGDGVMHAQETAAPVL